MPMEATAILMWVGVIAAVLGGIMLLAAVFVKKRDRLVMGGAIALILGIVIILLTVFVFGGQAQAITGVVTPSGVSEVQTAAGTVTVLGSGTSGQIKPIAEVKAFLSEFLSNSNTNVADGQLRFYNAGDDPSDTNVAYVDLVAIQNGEGTDSSPRIMAYKPYRVVYHDNRSTQLHYTQDFGLIQFNVDDEDGTIDSVTFENSADNGIAKIRRMASFDDFITDTNLSSTVNGGNFTISQTWVDGSPYELDGDGSNTLRYNETIGDATITFRTAFGITGADKVAREPVLCVEHESGVAPEGNEISDISIEEVSGSMNGIPGSFTDEWAGERCVQLGGSSSKTSEVLLAKGVSGQAYNERTVTEIAASTTGTFDWTVTFTEANLDGDDDWKLYIEDLGGINAKTVTLQKGMTAATLDFDHTA